MSLGMPGKLAVVAHTFNSIQEVESGGFLGIGRYHGFT